MGKVLTGKKAKGFHEKALAELDEGKTKHLKKEVCGYWHEKDVWVAFDNRTNELFTEDLKTKAGAIKYCK